MKIVKPPLPIPQEWVGMCNCCGLVVTAELKELNMEMMRRVDTAIMIFHDCPECKATASIIFKPICSTAGKQLLKESEKSE